MFEPETLFQSDKKVEEKKKETLLLQYEKDHLMLYDVYQMLDPFKIKIKINVYDKRTFALLASAQCDEEALKTELKKDGKQHLLEGHRRDELARYLIENAHLDKKQKLIFFMKSGLNLPP